MRADRQAANLRERHARNRDAINARRRARAEADRLRRAPQIQADARQRLAEGLCGDCWRLRERVPAVDGFRCQKHVDEHAARLAKRRTAAVLARRAARRSAEVEAIRLADLDRGGGSARRDRPTPYRAGDVQRLRAETGGLSQILKWG